MAGPTLLLATSNPGKRVELLALLPPGVRIVTLLETDITLPPETGDTFLANALTKATVAAAASGHIAVADDSGLAVDALAGAPGVHSARFAGEPPSDARNRAKLLQALMSSGEIERWARFHCAVVVADPGGRVATAEGTCEGHIGFAEVGDHGFGYDSLFVLPDGRTMAQLPLAEKNRISHRARAYAALAPTLDEWLQAAPSGGDQ